MTAKPRIAPEAAIAATMLAAAAAGYGLAAAGAIEPLQPAAGLHGTATEAAAIAARNGAVAAAFLLAAHVALTHRRAVMLTLDSIGLAILLPVSFLVGQFLAHGAGAWRFFVHAPLELGALAVAFGWWWRHHDHNPDGSATRRRLALVLAAIATAALIETFLTPNR